jgi:hypothetical protein
MQSFVVLTEPRTEQPFVKWTLLPIMRRVVAMAFGVNERKLDKRPAPTFPLPKPIVPKGCAKWAPIHYPSGTESDMVRNPRPIHPAFLRLQSSVSIL